MRRPMLAAFDFDGTLLDGDSITALMGLGADRDLKRLFESCHSSLDATHIFGSKIRDFQKSTGVTEEAIRMEIRKIPMCDGLDDVLQLLKSHGCDIIIVSDNMTMLVEDWLNTHSVSSLMEKVFANPSHVDSEGCIIMEPYHIQEWCDKSFRNLCKGHILEEYVASKKSEGVTFERVAYFGDGLNDLCPILRLDSKDLAFPRDGSRLLHMINSEAQGQVKASVYPWRSGSDVIQILTKYLRATD